MSYNTQNYVKQGGKELVVNGKLDLVANSRINGHIADKDGELIPLTSYAALPLLPSFANSKISSYSDANMNDLFSLLVGYVNDVIDQLKQSGIIQ